MSDKTARVHTHASIRANSREALERKVVFKSVLDNPFRLRWPSVSINVQNSILAQLLSILDSVSVYKSGNGHQRRKRKRAQKEQSHDNGVGNKRRKVALEKGLPTQIPAEGQGAEAVRVVHVESSAQDPPVIIEHLTVGINQVTKKLEDQIKSLRTAIANASNENASPYDPSSALVAIFVCRADVDPPLLIAHLPHLVAAYNSCLFSHPSPRLGHIKLVPLPKGAEFSLAEALGIRRVAALALDHATPNLSIFDPFLESVPILSAEWLVPPEIMQTKALVPTHIKQIKTSAPKDLKAAKEKRMMGRKDAREAKKNAPSLTSHGGRKA